MKHLIQQPESDRDLLEALKRKKGAQSPEAYLAQKAHYKRGLNRGKDRKRTSSRCGPDEIMVFGKCQKRLKGPRAESFGSGDAISRLIEELESFIEAE